MINRNEITSIAKKMMRQHRGLRDHQIIHPVRDWTIGVIISILMLAIVTWWSAMSYLAHSSTKIDNASDIVSTNTVYREAQVNEALKVFEKKREDYDFLLSGAKPIVVPEEDQETEEVTFEENVTEEIVTDSLEAEEEVRSDTEPEAPEGDLIVE